MPKSRGCVMPKRADHKKFVLTIGDIVAWSRGTSSLSARERCRPVGMVWHDSRKVKGGDVFVALKTEKDDGHRFVAAALKAGASAAIVEKNARFECPARYARKLI